MKQVLFWYVIFLINICIVIANVSAMLFGSGFLQMLFCIVIGWQIGQLVETELGIMEYIVDNWE